MNSAASPSNKAPRWPKGWTRGGEEEEAVAEAKPRELPLFQYWPVYSFQIGTWNEERWTFQNVTRLRAFDALPVCIVQGANLIPPPLSERVSLCRSGGGQKRSRGGGKAQINLISTHMQGCSLANLDNLELMAIKVPFIWCRAGVRGVQPNGNHDKWHPLSEGHFSSLDWFVISTFGIFFFFFFLNPGISSKWQSDIF